MIIIIIIIIVVVVTIIISYCFIFSVIRRKCHH